AVGAGRDGPARQDPAAERDHVAAGRVVDREDHAGAEPVDEPPAPLGGEARLDELRRLEALAAEVAGQLLPVVGRPPEPERVPRLRADPPLLEVRPGGRAVRAAERLAEERVGGGDDLQQAAALPERPPLAGGELLVAELE